MYKHYKTEVEHKRDNHIYLAPLIKRDASSNIWHGCKNKIGFRNQILTVFTNNIAPLLRRKQIVKHKNFNKNYNTRKPVHISDITHKRRLD